MDESDDTLRGTPPSVRAKAGSDDDAFDPERDLLGDDALQQDQADDQW